MLQKISETCFKTKPVLILGCSDFRNSQSITVQYSQHPKTGQSGFQQSFSGHFLSPVFECLGRHFAFKNRTNRLSRGIEYLNHFFQSCPDSLKTVIGYVKQLNPLKIKDKLLLALSLQELKLSFQLVWSIKR
jgi:hypothetical protein